MANSPHDPCPPRISVVIADDCPAMREGLARLVADECDLLVTGSAVSGPELRGLVARQAPQVLVLDLMLNDEDGLTLVKDLSAQAPQMRIVVFTGLPEDVYAMRALQAGAHAFVAKRDAVATLFRAIRETAAGGILVPAGVSGAIFRTAKVGNQPKGGLAAQLSDRELQVFRLVGLALSTRAVAERLGISVKTVETHRENIKNKLALNSHAELVATAAQWVRANGGST